MLIDTIHSKSKKGGFKMYKKIFFCVIVFTLIFSGCAKKEESGKKLEGINMKEGKWEITVSMESTGKMPMKIPPQTFTQCITKEKVVPEQTEATNQSCKIIKQELKGDTVSWIMECQTPEGKFVTEGTITYKGTTFDGISKMKHSGMEITQKMNGKWIGECK